MEWIKCAKRLPENEEECLVAFHIIIGNAGCGYAYSLATFIDFKFYSWELNNQINCVTHWMPLPESPQE